MTINVYRTKYFIVVQCITILYDHIENNSLISHDTYYSRTKPRDIAYEKYYRHRKNIDGKRIHSNMYERTYID